ncbi:50S ribosomal protein L6 [Candidatus Anaplasma sp. TIGMIC]|uniref:50S ribosomal protein L6 n=1 Tax=Candidatus Anaplasma sp. TIGMIC TaxID=3020713 RepID=UPI00232C8930|nr:50S ribosomal protein L6 [Candidatus Anaplasma sp. TIGMIC]MDB1135245.1 50S ribosomal protein L6 [Candidatus Anaplasma sp. TIGMIC]
MSRVGAMPIEIPEGVSVDICESDVTISDSKGGKSVFALRHGIKAVLDGKMLVLVNEGGGSARAKVMWGTYRSNISNAIKGMTSGFLVEFEVNGVGYKVTQDGECLNVSLGFSHSVKYAIPSGIVVKCTKPTQFTIQGSDKVKVHMVAADLCSIRRYDPYKGKGIFIKGKYVYRKEVSKKK